MEGDAGSGRLNPTPPADDDADSSAAEESVNQSPPADADPSVDDAQPSE